MTRQVRHSRRSKYGKTFNAGRGSAKRVIRVFKRKVFGSYKFTKPDAEGWVSIEPEKKEGAFSKFSKWYGVGQSQKKVETQRLEDRSLKLKEDLVTSRAQADILKKEIAEGKLAVKAYSKEKNADLSAEQKKLDEMKTALTSLRNQIDQDEQERRMIMSEDDLREKEIEAYQTRKKLNDLKDEQDEKRRKLARKYPWGGNWESKWTPLGDADYNRGWKSSWND